MSREPATLAEFFQGFIRKHSKTGPESGWLVLDVTPEECEELGRSFVYIMAGWAAGLDMARSKERGILMPDWLKPVGIVDKKGRLTGRSIEEHENGREGDGSSAAADTRSGE